MLSNITSIDYCDHDKIIPDSLKIKIDEYSYDFMVKILSAVNLNFNKNNFCVTNHNCLYIRTLERSK